MYRNNGSLLLLLKFNQENHNEITGTEMTGSHGRIIHGNKERKEVVDICNMVESMEIVEEAQVQKEVGRSILVEVGDTTGTYLYL